MGGKKSGWNLSGEGSSWLRKRWPQAQPNPGVCWRRRRRHAPQRSCSTLWGGKAARNLPDPLLHPPPSSLFPPPRSSSLLPPPSCPKPAASTDLSNGCTFLRAGWEVAQRLNPGATRGVLRGQLQPRSLGEAARKANKEGSAGRRLRAHRAPSLPPARPPAGGARTHLAPAMPPALDCGGSRPTEGVLRGRERVNCSSLPGECVRQWLECEQSKPERVCYEHCEAPLDPRSAMGAEDGGARRRGPLATAAL